MHRACWPPSNRTSSPSRARRNADSQPCIPAPRRPLSRCARPGRQARRGPGSLGPPRRTLRAFRRGGSAAPPRQSRRRAGRADPFWSARLAQGRSIFPLMSRVCAVGSPLSASASARRPETYAHCPRLHGPAQVRIGLRRDLKALPLCSGRDEGHLDVVSRAGQRGADRGPRRRSAPRFAVDAVELREVLQIRQKRPGADDVRKAETCGVEQLRGHSPSPARVCVATSPGTTALSRHCARPARRGTAYRPS